MVVNTKKLEGDEEISSGFPENYVNKLFIDRHPTFNNSGDVDITDVTTGDWARLAGGINSITESNNDTTAQNYYYDGNGDPDTDVTGVVGSMALAGNRKIGDPAQDYIHRIKYLKGQHRKTRLIFIENGHPIVSACTITNPVTTGGAPNAKETFSCTINKDGSPRLVDGKLTMYESKTEARVYSAVVESSTEDEPVASVVAANESQNIDKNDASQLAPKGTQVENSSDITND